MTATDDTPAYGLWPLVVLKCRHFHRFRLQLLSSANGARLALIRSVLSFSRRAVHGDVFGGFVLLSAAWSVLYKAHQRRQLAEWNVPGAQRKNGLATTGPYAHVRHPQYVAFALIMIGFLLQWPTLVTLVMFPILVTMYVRLARREERETPAEFGDEYARYMASVPAFIQRRHRTADELGESGAQL